MDKTWPTLQQQLAEYTPRTRKSQEIKTKFVTFLNENKYCFERRELSRHFTSSALLFNKQLNKILLTHHKKLDKWLQLGGHCDGNLSTLQVAILECQEESGINNISVLDNKIFDLDIHSIPKHKNVCAHYHYDICYLLKIESDEDDIIISDESLALRWFGIDEILNTNMDIAAKNIVEKYKNSITAPLTILQP
ncbi:MAG: NUDIX hydrolase [Francisellaceae bacterium]|jgi:8-oxo-dGTP pyrophosphatase MutT (NUDIX family)|nr:NUDIX hydrolase [Francisellaceae bacterium]MBT6539700.1 NUDIX hydrolase [Francisellaceae bacterium]